MKRASHLPVAALALLLASCSSSESSDAAPASAATPTGKVRVHFSLSDKVRGEITSPAKGTVYGELYLREDITLTGPRKGATAVASVKVVIDITTDKVSTSSYASTPLSPNQYGFLGFFDVDANAADPPSPAKGDPVTLPTDAIYFEVKSGDDKDVTVPFELTYNQ